MNERTIRLARDQLLDLLLDLDNAETRGSTAESRLATAEAELEKCLQATTGATLDKEYSQTVTAVIELRQDLGDAIKSLQAATVEATRWKDRALTMEHLLGEAKTQLARARRINERTASRVRTLTKKLRKLPA